MVFSPDGKRIVSGGWDNTVRLWDAGTGKPLGDPLTRHTNYVTSVAFSPDGTRLASSSLDAAVRLWPTYRDATSAACALLTTNMSHRQWQEWVSPHIKYIKVCPQLPDPTG